jgi:ribosomal protein S18 acetylase RimI-like enzyme
MTTTTPALRIADATDIDPVADLIADAFDHLRVIHYLVPDAARRKRVAREWYRLYVEHAINGAGQVVTTADQTAAAVWFDRTGPVTEPADYTKRLADLAEDNVGRFVHLDTQMDAHHPSDPHWHLLFLAVRPDRWSQGLGTALMNHTQARLDEQGIAAYLEATGEQNRRLYRRHDYIDMAPPTIPVSPGIGLYRMWRPATR